MVTSISKLPRAFELWQSQVEEIKWRNEINTEIISYTPTIAPYGMALAAEVKNFETEGNGKLIILYNPKGNPDWQGSFRFVSYTQADVPMEMVSDPLLAEVGWSWFEEGLCNNQAKYTNPSGSVSVQFNKCFGALAETEANAEIEIRASWTPILSEADLSPHLLAWQDILCLTTGLQVLPPGVVQIPILRPL